MLMPKCDVCITGEAPRQLEVFVQEDSGERKLARLDLCEICHQISQNLMAAVRRKTRKADSN
jgi:hypothetical protein